MKAGDLWDKLNEMEEFDDCDLDLKGNVVIIEYVGGMLLEAEEFLNILNILGELGVVHNAMIYTSNGDFNIEVYCGYM